MLEVTIERMLADGTIQGLVVMIALVLLVGAVAQLGLRK